jgi:hypothetical protein
VTPRVTPEGIVVMEVDVTKSQLSDTEGVNLPSGDGGTFFQPNIDEIVAVTTVSARSGQTVVFAGLIETTKADIKKGIPWLSDLPVVGPMFAFRTKTDRRSELLIILTPQVIYANDEQEIDWIKYAETERMSWCLADVAQMFDITGMSARPGSWCACPDMLTVYPADCPTGTPVPMEHYRSRCQKPNSSRLLARSCPTKMRRCQDRWLLRPTRLGHPAGQMPRPVACGLCAGNHAQPAGPPNYPGVPAYYHPTPPAPPQGPAPYGVWNQ